MKYLVFLLMFLVSCGSKPIPSIPVDVLAELQANSNTMFNLSGEVDWNLSKRLDRHTEKHKVGDTILIYINSNGGDVNAAENIMNTMSRFKTVCVADTAMSAAFEIYESCTVRVYMDRTLLMTHHHFITFSKNQMNVTDVFVAGLDAYIQEKYLLTKAALRMEMTYSELSEKITKGNGEWYIYGKDIIKFNAADYHIKDAQLKVAK